MLPSAHVIIFIVLASKMQQIYLFDYFLIFTFSVLKLSIDMFISCPVLVKVWDIS